MELTQKRIEESSAMIKKIADNIEKVIIGKRDKIELVILAMLCGGNVLIEDVPGVGKTSLVSAFAKSVSCDFSRIQFTPDVMPSDVTGFSIFNQKTREFEFRPGSVMSNIILADEINRASAKTQSSLLEAMEEKQVTVDSNTYKLEEPFMVLATENPLESYGTYPLPEAQIDRFMMKLSLGYAEFNEEVKIISMSRDTKEALQAVASKEEIIALRKAAENIFVSPMISEYIVRIVTATRNNSDIAIGSSPRGGISLYQLSRAYALSKGRSYVIPDDIKYLVPYVLVHRVSLTHDAKVRKKTAEDILGEILSSVAVPIAGEEKFKQNENK